MSRTTIFIVRPNGTVEEYANFRNSWGSARLVWDYFAAKYFPKDTRLSFDSSLLDDIWKMASRTDIPLFERAVMMTTFDHVLCRRAYLDQLSTHFELFAAALPKVLDMSTRANQIPAQSKAYREISGMDDVMAICWQQTSTAMIWPEEFWSDYTKDPKHWFMDDEI